MRAVKLRDPAAGLLHLAGALISVVGLVFLVKYAVLNKTIWHIVSFTVYGITLIFLYTSSSLYHLLQITKEGTAFLRRIDHIMINFLIAGTYTPFCLVPLRGVWGWSILGTIWGLAVFSTILKIFWMGAPRWLNVAIYLTMGWISMIIIYPLTLTAPLGAIIWLLGGGLFYTFGAVIYGLKRPDPFPDVFGFHEIWHIFVMGGSFCHYYSIIAYL